MSARLRRVAALRPVCLALAPDPRGGPRMTQVAGGPALTRHPTARVPSTVLSTCFCAESCRGCVPSASWTSVTTARCYTYLNSVSASGSFVAHASCCGRSPKRRPGALGGNRKQHTEPSQTPRPATGGGQHWSGGTACLEALHSRKSETEPERTCGSEIAEETSFDIGGLAD